MQYLGVEIRPATIEDLPVIMSIENVAFKHPWKQEDIAHEITNNPFANFWVCELEIQETKQKVVAGFVDYWSTFDTGTICKIAVHPYLQHRQLGSAMMDEVFNDCFAKKIQTITLEVRVSNTNAINFYKKHGFQLVTTKEKYYDDGEDAFYMVAEVK